MIFKILATHDIYNREDAIAIINKQMYMGKDHSHIISEYLRDYEKYDNPSINRPDADKIINNEENDIESIAFAHCVENDDYMGYTIFLETESLNNISKDEAVEILKSYFPDAEIYDDDSYPKDGGEKELYTRLAYKDEDERDILLTPAPLYCQDYFKARDPELLKKNKEKHERGEYRDQDSIDGLDTRITAKKSRLKRK